MMMTRIMTFVLFLFVQIAFTSGVPYLQAIQNLSVYVPSDDITLVCCSQYPLTNQIFEFYKEDSAILSIEEDKTCASYVFKITTQQDIGPYYCTYKALENETYVQSSMSNPITFPFAEPPPVPSIALEPLQPVYITGETVSIICSVPQYLNDLKSIKFYRSGLCIHTEEACDQKCIYTISDSTKQLNGDYSCGYLMLKHGRVLSAHSQSVQVNIKDIPQTPSINLSPKLPVYINGETVSITCSIPEEATAIGIQYIRDNQVIHKLMAPKTRSTYVLSHLSMENTGSYECQYWLYYSGRQISSARSLPISITVEEIPQPPSIDLYPMLPVYTRGESISIRCLPPNGSEVAHIQYFKDDKKFHKSLEKLYMISSLSQESKGNYSCAYMCNRYERQIFSKTSPSVSIAIVDIPPAPSITLTPELPLYITGEMVTIECSLPENTKAIGIQYFKDNQEANKSKTHKTMSSYVLSNVSMKNTGSYTCQYWLSYFGRHISSTRSLPVSIFVEDLPVSPVLKLAPNLEIYVVGESLVLTCSGFVNARHNIYKDGLLLKNDFSHLIPSLQLSHNGNYTCTYNLDNKGRQMESSRSETVNIYVIEPLPAPMLALGGPIVKGEDRIKVTLNCSAPDDDLLRTFYYFSTTGENAVTNMTAFSASFKLELELISHISYICEYEQELRGRKIRSRRSQTLLIQLPDDRHNRFRFSWYWKENQSPKKPNSLHPLSPVKKNEETNQTLDVCRDNYKIDTRNPSCLSIATQKEVDAIDKAVNFSTFHYESLSEGDSAWHSSIC